MRRGVIVALALALGCGAKPVGSVIPDAGADLAAVDLAGGCYMVQPAARCGDGVCDPGCEGALDCPDDCALPDGGVACTGPATWTCSPGKTARVECYRGRLVVERCAGACETLPADWPAQCHGCRPCDGFFQGKGLPYLYTCNQQMPSQRRRCIDVSNGGDCVQDVSDPAHCCAIDDDCAGGACLPMPEGMDDLCP